MGRDGTRTGWVHGSWNWGLFFSLLSFAKHLSLILMNTVMAAMTMPAGKGHASSQSYLPECDGKEKEKQKLGSAQNGN